MMSTSQMEDNDDTSLDVAHLIVISKLLARNYFIIDFTSFNDAVQRTLPDFREQKLNLITPEIQLEVCIRVLGNCINIGTEWKMKQELDIPNLQFFSKHKLNSKMWSKHADIPITTVVEAIMGKLHCSKWPKGLTGKLCTDFAHFISLTLYPRKTRNCLRV